MFKTIVIVWSAVLVIGLGVVAYHTTDPAISAPAVVKSTHVVDEPDPAQAERYSEAGKMIIRFGDLHIRIVTQCHRWSHLPNWRNCEERLREILRTVVVSGALASQNQEAFTAYVDIVRKMEAEITPALQTLENIK